MICPVDDCDGTIEAATDIWFDIDGNYGDLIDVFGINLDGLRVVCDNRGHELDPQQYRPLYERVWTFIRKLEAQLGVRVPG